MYLNTILVLNVKFIRHDVKRHYCACSMGPMRKFYLLYQLHESYEGEPPSNTVGQASSSAATNQKSQSCTKYSLLLGRR